MLERGWHSLRVRTCNACGKTRDLIAFYRNRREAGGYEPRCKLCFNKARAEHAGTLGRDSKTCSSCKISKPLDAFYKLSLSRDGRGHYCKECAQQRNREYRAANPRTSLQSKLTAQIFRENQDPEERRKYRREYYHKNKERILQQRKEKRANAAMR